MSDVLKRVDLYREKSDVLNPYTLELMRIDSDIIKKQIRFYIMITTPELSGKWTDHQISFEVSATTAEEEFKRALNVVRYMVRPEYEEWKRGEPVKQG